MKRLTTDKPDGNFETMLNYVFGKDGWAHIRYDGENLYVPLTEWAKKQCLSHGCDEFPEANPQEIDQDICDCMMDYPGCPVALAYCFASQATHMRDRLKMYEDILFAEDGTELVSLDDLREMIKARDNPPLTHDSATAPSRGRAELDSAQALDAPVALSLEELREMDGEPVWLEVLGADGHYVMFLGYKYDDTCAGFYREISRPTDEYGKTWLAYRRKPEGGMQMLAPTIVWGEI